MLTCVEAKLSGPRTPIACPQFPLLAGRATQTLISQWYCFFSEAQSHFYQTQSSSLIYFGDPANPTEAATWGWKIEEFKTLQGSQTWSDGTLGVGVGKHTVAVVSYFSTKTH